MSVSKSVFAPLCAVVLISSNNLSYADMPADVAEIQHKWAVINYKTLAKERADEMFELVEHCDSISNPESPAETFIWCGIVRSTYAGMASTFSAMKYAKGARADLEKAIEIDGSALAGSAYTSLGTLYFKVPGWPVGFGDDKKAREYLHRGLELNPHGIDPNYFYADFLYEEGDWAEAREYLLKAQQAPARRDRPIADAGRQQEIQDLLTKVSKKMGK